MKMNVSDAAGTMVVTTKGLEAEEGELKKLRVTLALDFVAQPQFLDDFLDNVHAGILPSNTYWNPGEKPDDPKAMRYQRQPGVAWMELGAPAAERKFAVKLRNLPPEEWDGDQKDFPGAIVATLHGFEIKKISVMAIANGCRVKMKAQLDGVQPELAEDLVRLTLVDELVLDCWLINRDLEASPTAEPPARPAGDAAEQGAEKAAGGKKGRAQKGASIHDLFPNGVPAGKDAAAEQGGSSSLPE